VASIRHWLSLAAYVHAKASRYEILDLHLEFADQYLMPLLPSSAGGCDMPNVGFILHCCFLRLRTAALVAKGFESCVGQLVHESSAGLTYQ
jgi:hypothetical protein